MQRGKWIIVGKERKRRQNVAFKDWGSRHTRCVRQAGAG